ncbi:MAG TPA: hypothetical protein DD723_00565 [Candidatus Omnitrophica bacterium]|nr:MAG: hypothetical protein A2Z81_09540 [Omnitrophica WOR_2 bacterium GWA2_45_18]OGX18742.1 MAG: hypothetical protein A2Y04_03030 [Omnitrophica WOR_2 bacterium GWC2_45_7]HBR14024.1 hypothetical protein [Candidatus Omnitrophota bacterium]
MNDLHTFHIPVMGTGFTINTPVKVAQYGISSVISLVDDTLIEQMRQYYCGVMEENYIPITQNDEDYRARRITAYLDLLDRIVKKNFEEVKSSCFEINTEITKYFEMLPETSPLKTLYHQMLAAQDPVLKKNMQDQLRSQMRPGAIDVNIMTKLDRLNYGKDNTPLPSEFSDALAALRGYAKSTLNSAVVFSAGINRKLYSYVEKFKDFYADASGFIKKRIVLKVTDYRSSIIQGKFFAQKGIWVSEYRVESGLNCGGHAFASNGSLMGPILEEFKTKRQEFIQTLQDIYEAALKLRNEKTFNHPHPIKITAQGGIGTHQEHNFLLSYYQLESAGWGTPFLLVPETTSVDPETLEKLCAAGEEDVELSDVSPLGVPFNNLKASLSEIKKFRRIEKGRAGSACLKGYLVSNTEFTEKPICTASRQYQKLKLDQLLQMDLDSETYKIQHDAIVNKSCICHDLAASPLINYQLSRNNAQEFTAVCPGPNIAYFSKIVSLADMVGHIYGRVNLLNTQQRSHMFIKELNLYMDYFIKEVKKLTLKPTEKQIAHLNEFKNNLLEGIEYYKKLFPKMLDETQEHKNKALEELQSFKKKIDHFIAKHRHIFPHSLSTLASV